jgi:hypothetical protein
VTRHRSSLAIAAVLALSAVPGRAQDAPASGPGLRDQLSITLPEGWVVWDESEVASGTPGPVGMVVFSAESVMKGPTAPPDHALIARVYSGEIPTFFLERVPARKGMSCDKLSRGTILDVGSRVARDPSVSTSNWVYRGGNPPHEDVEIGGCRGVRFVIEFEKKDPAKHRVLDERVASDGKTLYLFKLRTDGSHYAKNLEVFERAVASVRFTLAK